MEIYLLSIIGAFLLFAVILPLAGIVLGLFGYYLLPYLFGGLASLVLLTFAGVKIVLVLWLWIVTLLWASAVLFLKMRFRQLGEEIEHYRAAHVTLLFGMPYRRRRDQLRVDLAVEGEI